MLQSQEVKSPKDSTVFSYDSVLQTYDAASSVKLDNNGGALSGEIPIQSDWVGGARSTTRESELIVCCNARRRVQAASQSQRRASR